MHSEFYYNLLLKKPCLLYKNYPIIQYHHIFSWLPLACDRSILELRENVRLRSNMISGDHVTIVLVVIMWRLFCWLPLNTPIQGLSAVRFLVLMNFICTWNKMHYPYKMSHEMEVFILLKYLCREFYCRSHAAIKFFLL